MRSALVLSLALMPPLMAAIWTLFQVRKVEKELGALNDFDGIHF